MSQATDPYDRDFRHLVRLIRGLLNRQPPGGGDDFMHWFYTTAQPRLEAFGRWLRLNTNRDRSTSGSAFGSHLYRLDCNRLHANWQSDVGSVPDQTAPRFRVMQMFIRGAQQELRDAVDNPASRLDPDLVWNKAVELAQQEIWNILKNRLARQNNINRDSDVESHPDSDEEL